MKKEILITLAAASLLTACRSTDRTVGFQGSQLDDLPPAAQTTIRNEIGAAEIVDIDKERRSGRLTYEITYQAAPGAQEKLHVTEDGRLLNSKQASVAGWILPEPAKVEEERAAYTSSELESQKSDSQFSTAQPERSATLKSDAQFKNDAPFRADTRAQARTSDDFAAQTQSSAQTEAQFKAQTQPATVAKSDSAQADYSATEEAKTSGPLIGTKFEDLPAAVQNTIQEQHSSAEIADIDKETRDGRVVYQVSFKESGRNSKIHIAEDGALMSQSEFRERSGAAREALHLEKGVRGGAQGLLEQSPAGVGNAELGVRKSEFREGAGAEVKSDLKEAKENIEDTAEAAGDKLKAAGAEIKATGKAIANELRMTDLPAPVQKSIRTHSRDGKVATIEKTTLGGKTVYQVKYVDSTKNPTLHFSEDGTWIENK